MSGTPSTKVTVVNVTTTGHIVAAASRTNTSGPTPSAQDLVGDGIRFRSAPTASPSSPLFTFVIPVSELTAALPVDVDSKTLGPTSWGKTMNVANSGSSGPILASQSPSVSSIGSPPVLPPLNMWVPTPPSTLLTSKASPLVVTFTSPPAPASLPYYVVVSDPLTVLGFPATAKGTLPSPGNYTFNLTITNIALLKNYAALVLVQSMQPYVTAFNTQ